MILVLLTTKQTHVNWPTLLDNYIQIFMIKLIATDSVKCTLSWKRAPATGSRLTTW